MKPILIFYMVVLICNLTSLYFIIALFCYDEVVGFLISVDIKSIDPRNRAYLLFVNCLLNLYFLSYVLMEKYFKIDGDF